MIVPAAVQQKHSFSLPYVEEVGGRVRDVVSGYCESNGYAYLGRVKTLNSLAEKLETGRYRRWHEVDDLYACAVIVPTLSDEAGVLSFLQGRFREVECRLRATSRKDPDVFRFDATRFIGSLVDSDSGSSSLSHVLFEVQIRSAFEHAWSVTTHALSYKGGNVGWRHKRISAQLRAAIEQLDQVVLGYQEWAGLIKEQSWPVIDEQRKIAERFLGWVEEGLIPSEVKPESWVRFSENLRALIAASMQWDKHGSGHSKNVNAALGAIEAELKRVGKVAFPRSLSLYQFSLGALSKAGLLGLFHKDYSPLVTEELLTMYPDVKNLQCTPFDFEQA